MRRHLLRLLAALLATHVFADDAEQEKRQLQQLGKKIQAIQSTIQSASREIRRLEKRLEQSERQLAQTRSTILTTNQQIADSESTLQALQQQKQSLEKKSTQQRKAMARQLNLSYRLGREPTLKLLLNQQDPALLGRTMRYHHYFLQARADKLSEFLETITALATNEADINQQLTALATQKATLSQQLETALQQQQQRSKALQALNQSLESDQQKLAKLALEHKRLERIIRELAEAIAAIPTPQSYQPFTKRKGRLSWPVRGSLEKKFGQTRNTKMTWDGWLISATEGTQVQAIHSGRVVFADYLRGHGLLVVVDHGEGYMSLYAHNQVLLAETGDWIESGSTIAKVGLTGGQNQAGLYFEIRHQGKPTNPSRWLKTKG